MFQTHTGSTLDRLDHAAIEVEDVERAVTWYTKMFRCRVSHQDETSAMLEFANTRLALVSAQHHHADIGLVSLEAQSFAALTSAGDAPGSVYVNDPAGNGVEIRAQQLPWRAARPEHALPVAKAA